MHLWSLMEETRWGILKSISGTEMSMAEIAQAMNTSVPNISQHLKILEAYGYVDKNKIANGKPGKPVTYYSTKKGIAVVAVADSTISHEKIIQLKNRHDMATVSMLAFDPEERYLLSRLLWRNDDIVDKCKAICLLRSSREKTELLLLTDQVAEIREKYSSITIKYGEKEKEIACWTHTEKEIEEGTGRGDNYFLDLVKKFDVIYDSENIMTRWKR